MYFKRLTLIFSILITAFCIVTDVNAQRGRVDPEYDDEDYEEMQRHIAGDFTTFEIVRSIIGLGIGCFLLFGAISNRLQESNDLTMLCIGVVLITWVASPFWTYLTNNVIPYLIIGGIIIYFIWQKYFNKN